MEVKDVIHLYLGCEVRRDHYTESKFFPEFGKLVGVSASEVERGKTVAVIDNGLDHFHEWYVEETKPILRRLDSMTESEAHELAFICMDHDSFPKEDRVTREEVEAEIEATNDGGLMVDLDCAVVIYVSCRCYEGQLAIRTNGDLELWTDDDKQGKAMSNQAKVFVYLLSKGFWIFGDQAFEDGLIIEKI